MPRLMLFGSGTPPYPSGGAGWPPPVWAGGRLLRPKREPRERSVPLLTEKPVETPCRNGENFALRKPTSPSQSWWVRLKVKPGSRSLPTVLVRRRGPAGAPRLLRLLEVVGDRAGIDAQDPELAGGGGGGRVLPGRAELASAVLG